MNSSSTITPPDAPRRSPQLDVLRGIAILLVLGRHYVVGAPDAGLLLPVAGVWQRFGWAGVDLFFVLSGFLIGGLLFNELRTHHRLDTPRFIFRRGMRIWPAYYLFLLFLALPFHLQPVVISPYEPPFRLLPSLLHIQNYSDMPRSHLWSLAVEEHVYLLLPLLLLILVKAKAIRFFPHIALTLIAAITLLRCAVPALLPFPWKTHVYPTHMRADSILFGVLLAYFQAFYPAFRAACARFRFPLIAGGLLLISPMLLLKLETNWIVPTLGFSALYVGFGAILLGFIHVPLPTATAPRLPARLLARTATVIATIGFYSYAIYLWHFDAAKLPIDHLLANGFFRNWPPELRFLSATLLYLALAVLAGFIISTLIDFPMLRLRDRLFPAKSRVAIPPATAPVSPDSAPAIPTVTPSTNTRNAWV